jgi:hypothetical protein
MAPPTRHSRGFDDREAPAAEDSRALCSAGWPLASGKGKVRYGMVWYGMVLWVGEGEGEGEGERGEGGGL